jgi:hypothetical protein
LVVMEGILSGAAVSRNPFIVSERQITNLESRASESFAEGLPGWLRCG